MPGRRTSRHAVWIAFAAVLLSALPPAVTHARHAAVPWGAHDDLCSAAGSRAPTPVDTRPSEPPSTVCAHCDGCAGHFANDLAPPPTGQMALAVGPVHFAIDRGAQFRCVSCDLLAAHPRGPPLLA